MNEWNLNDEWQTYTIRFENIFKFLNWFVQNLNISTRWREIWNRLHNKKRKISIRLNVLNKLLLWNAYIDIISDHKQNCIFDNLNKIFCLFWKNEWKIITSKSYCQRIFSFIDDMIVLYIEKTKNNSKYKLNSHAFKVSFHAKWN